MKSDIVGSIASGLCVIHCIATPFIFVVQTCSTSSCCNSSPVWWSFIDYNFILITFFAVIQSILNTAQPVMKYGFFLTWLLLTFLVINQKMVLFSLSDTWKHVAAVFMIMMHLYNYKFCPCPDQECCLE